MRDAAPITVADYIARLQQFPADWRVIVSTPAGGGIAIEHRDLDGEPIIAIFGSNGGRFGENPLTDKEYRKKSQEFLSRLESGQYRYTTIHGDHRLYIPYGHPNETCYGEHYDPRIIDRMVQEGLLEYYPQPHSRLGVRRRRP